MDIALIMRALAILLASQEPEEGEHINEIIVRLVNRAQEIERAPKLGH